MGRPKAPAWEPGKITSEKDTAGRWEARTRYRDAIGESRQIRRSGRTKGAAETAVKRAIREHKDQYERTQEEEVLTVAVLADAWLKSRKPADVVIDPRTQEGQSGTDGLGMQSWLKYRNKVRDYVKPAIGDVPVSVLATPACEALVHSIYDKQAGTGYRTAAMVKHTLQQIMDHAIRQGYRVDNPVRSVSRIPKPRRKPEAMDQDTVNSVHEAAQARQPEPGVGGPRPTSRLADTVVLLAGTGIRIGEALAVRFDDVDLGATPPTVTVSGTLVEQDGLFFRQSYPKTVRSYRVIPLSPWVAPMFLKRRANAPASHTGAVFATRNGTFVRPSNFRQGLRVALKKAGIFERITPHTFRRTVATRLYDALGDKAAAAQLGHASTDVTNTYYISRPDLVPDYSAALAGMAPRRESDKSSIT